MMKRSAFTMIEVIFVIVILGILAIIAVPKFMATRDDARMVALAQNIATGASDIASYMVARGEAENDLSKMSNSLHSLVKRGEATVDTVNRSIKVKAGNETECITIEIVSANNDENLTLINKTTTDEECSVLQKMIPENIYPIALKGARVVTN